MKVQLEPGKYVVAVSGGVDSMALLRILKDAPGLEIVVAHYDHGMRSDSREDRELVQATASRYNLQFRYEEGRLGTHVSEAAAREARYRFLEQIRKERQAQAIITAHHEDDLIETAIINLIRGTGRKGLATLTGQKTVIRPLLHMNKKTILDYAQKHKLAWREDTTNADESYLRNYIRRRLLPKFNAKAKASLLHTIERTRNINAELDALLADLIRDHSEIDQLDRHWFTKLTHDLAKECLATWLRQAGIQGFDAKLLERVTIAAKVQRPGTSIDLLERTALLVEKDQLALVGLER